MGHVRPIENVGQNGEKSGTTSLEITYGGMESPFGGVHYGPAPAYIDPKCFADANNFFVVDNKLVLMSLEPFTIPTLWNNAIDVLLLKLGTFYNSKYGQLNYALGVNFNTQVINGVDVSKGIFYITIWNYNNSRVPVIQGNDSLEINLYKANSLAAAASITIPVIMGESSTFTDTGILGISYGVSGTVVGTVLYGYTSGDTIQNVVTGIVAGINGVSGSTLFTAAASVDGMAVILTAVTPGAAGNNLFVQDDSSSNSSNTPPAFYFPISITGESSFTNLQGGVDSVTNAPTQLLSRIPISTTDVGGTLYISGLINWPIILKYSGPGTFTISSTYQGIQILKKFAGSLIGIGVLPQLLNVIQNQNMIFAWSAAEDLDEWSPEDSAGNVTGAGFEQLADIGDFLTGLIVSNNVAYIIRSQGLSYATALGSGTNPFQIAHIGLGHTGEGCQLSSLVSDYDQTGVYVGNSNIFQISGSIGPIGDKVKSNLIPLLTLTQSFIKSVVFPAINDGGDTYPLILIIVGSNFYFYNSLNQTWMTFYSLLPNNANAYSCDVLFYGAQNTLFKQFPAVVAVQQTVASAVLVYALEETIPTENTLCTGPSYVTFPQEEILFGRDITIDALYVSLWADLEEDVIVNFLFNGVHFGSLTLTAADFTTLSGQPTNLQVFPDASVLATSGVFTAKSPQLQISVPSVTDTQLNQLRFAKIQMYASFDPKQRPV